MLPGLVVLVPMQRNGPARIREIRTTVTFSAIMLVKTIIADLVWEIEFLQGRWAMARQDWQILNRQALNHQVMHHRLQDELQSLRCRVQHVEEIARSLHAAGGEAVGLSLLQAICRAVLTESDEQHCSPSEASPSCPHPLPTVVGHPRHGSVPGQSAATLQHPHQPDARDSSCRQLGLPSPSAVEGYRPEKRR